jgi:hypothetical protein
LLLWTARAATDWHCMAPGWGPRAVCCDLLLFLCHSHWSGVLLGFGHRHRFWHQAAAFSRYDSRKEFLAEEIWMDAKCAMCLTHTQMWATLCQETPDTVQVQRNDYGMSSLRFPLSSPLLVPQSVHPHGVTHLLPRSFVGSIGELHSSEFREVILRPYSEQATPAHLGLPPQKKSAPLPPGVRDTRHIS